MRLFRIVAARFAQSRRAALSGRGGIEASARWHTAGRPIVYTSQSLSLAALEILVHLKQADDLQPFRSFAAEIPDELIAVPRRYPARWRSDYRASRAFGDAWLGRGLKPAVRVPSVITPGEWNYLLNPQHPDLFLEWVASGPTLFEFDPRLLDARRSTH